MERCAASSMPPSRAGDYRLRRSGEEPLAPEFRERPNLTFAEPNDRLEELLGRHFGWTRHPQL